MLRSSSPTASAGPQLGMAHPALCYPEAVPQAFGLACGPLLCRSCGETLAHQAEFQAGGEHGVSKRALELIGQGDGRAPLAARRAVARQGYRSGFGGALLAALHLQPMQGHRHAVDHGVRVAGEPKT